MRPLACWDHGFESHRRHGCLSVVSVMCCQVEVSATSSSLVQRSPTDCGASSCVIKKPQKWGGHGPRWAAAPQKTKQTYAYYINENTGQCQLSIWSTQRQHLPKRRLTMRYHYLPHTNSTQFGTQSCYVR